MLINLDEMALLLNMDSANLFNILTLIGWTGVYIYTALTVFTVLFVDSITRTSVNPIKIAIYVLISIAIVVTSFLPDQGAKDIQNITYYAQASNFTFRAIIYTLYAINVFVKSPKEFERFSIFLLASYIFGWIIPAFNILTKFSVPGLGINELLQTFGFLILAILFTRDPRFFFHTSLTTSRLAIFSSDGTLLLSHSWIQEKLDLESEIITDSLKQASETEVTKEVHLDKVILVIRQISNVSFVLITEKTSKMLNNSLNSFSDKFIQVYGSNITEPITNEKQIDEITALLSEIFQYIPTYTD
jgi:hypothetical protein